jgi:hypothetical protein
MTEFNVSLMVSLCKLYTTRDWVDTVRVPVLLLLLFNTTRKTPARTPKHMPKHEGLNRLAVRCPPMRFQQFQSV